MSPCEASSHPVRPCQRGSVTRRTVIRRARVALAFPVPLRFPILLPSLVPSSAGLTLVEDGGVSVERLRFLVWIPSREVADMQGDYAPANRKHGDIVVPAERCEPVEPVLTRASSGKDSDCRCKTGAGLAHGTAGNRGGRRGTDVSVYESLGRGLEGGNAELSLRREDLRRGEEERVQLGRSAESGWRGQARRLGGKLKGAGGGLPARLVWDRDGRPRIGTAHGFDSGHRTAILVFSPNVRMRALSFAHLPWLLP
jgi:hypothetical protein